MKNSIVLLAAAFLCLVTFPTTTVGKHLDGWPNPSEIFTNKMMFLNNVHSFSYGDSKVWKCTYSNGSAPAISISDPGSPTPSTPSLSPSPPTPKTSPPPPTPKKSPSPPSIPTPKPKKSPSPPSLPPPTPPKKSPSPPSIPPPTPKKSPSPPSLPPPTPKKSPSPPPSDDQPTTPSNPPAEHHHSHHHHQNPWEHIESCMRNMGPVGMCRWQMELSFHTRLFRVSNYCCNLVANMRSECDDVAWGFFTDPFFVPLVRYTCHVNC